MANEWMHKFSFPAKDKKEYDAKKAEYNKNFSAMMKKAREKTKLKNCYLCGKDATSFCNSHSIPQFCLKNIAADGVMYSSNAAIEAPFGDEKLGINNAGVFHLICPECDNSEFADYENPSKYVDVPTPKMLSQIAMKTYLKEIHKRHIQKAMYENLESELGFKIGDRLEITNIDLGDLVKDFNYTRRELLKGRDNTAWHMCYYKKLDYVVPFAFQSKVTLISGLANETINDVYDYSSGTDKFNDLHICVFPLDGFSIVMLFVKEGSKNLRKFYKTLNKLDPLDQLHVIAYIIFLYSEEVYINKRLEDIIKNNKALKEAAKKTTAVYSEGEIDIKQSIALAKEQFDLSKRAGFPNLLSEEYSKKCLPES
jgi:hypothetical protein